MTAEQRSRGADRPVLAFNCRIRIWRPPTTRRARLRSMAGVLLAAALIMVVVALLQMGALFG